MHPAARPRVLLAYHGPAALLSALPDAQGFALKMEHKGLKFSAAGLWQSDGVVDRELITGQNPFSAPAVGAELLKRL